MAISLIAAVLATTLTWRASGATLPEKPEHGPLKPPASPPPPVDVATPDIPQPHIGKLELLSASSGVPAMHAAAMLDGKVVFLDKVENYTQLRLSNGQLAYSSIYDPELQTTPKPLAYQTNAFCCGGSFLADGRLVTVGGNGPLDFIDPTEESDKKLASKRWYASAQTLADGSVFVASGSLNGLDPLKNENNNPTFEILNRDGISNGRDVAMKILEKAQPYHMYPFIHLLPDESLFILADRSCQLFDPQGNNVMKELPELAGMHRTYPTTGGSVLMPLTSARNFEPEIMVCGGGAFQDIKSPTDDTCGKIKPLSKKPRWKVLKMPQGRGMVEGVLLLDGTVLWINGAEEGAEGFGIAQSPTLEALIYDPKDDSWTAADRSTIARMYHSVALMLKDGSVLIAGSNPNEMPVLLNAINVNDPLRAFPTEFRMEKYTPAYLMGNPIRPQLVLPPFNKLKPGQEFELQFKTPWPRNNIKSTKVVMHHGGFVTHALHMGQRMIELFHDMSIDKDEMVDGLVTIYMPAKYGIVPPGPYWLFVLVNGVPSEGISMMVE